MHRCLSNLSDITHEGYSARATRQLAGGQRKFPSRLTFDRSDVVEFRMKEAEHMSISGVQDKISLKLVRGKLVPTETNGEYILKPAPSADIPRMKADIPANEHLTMQLASQVAGVVTAVNGCIRFADGELAYITKRFDRLKNGMKIGQEDFCQLSNRTEEATGKNYKYDASYEETGRILKKYCSAYAVEVEKLFRRILFSYVFSNGDAHLKNFSLYRSEFGDHVLTPAYDLICTSMHFPTESRMALDLFDDFQTESFKAQAFYKRSDFMKLADLYGIEPPRVTACLDQFSSARVETLALIERSLLSAEAKRDYCAQFEDRLATIGD